MVLLFYVQCEYKLERFLGPLQPATCMHVAGHSWIKYRTDNWTTDTCNLEQRYMQECVLGGNLPQVDYDQYIFIGILSKTIVLFDNCHSDLVSTGSPLMIRTLQSPCSIKLWPLLS